MAPHTHTLKNIIDHTLVFHRFSFIATQPEVEAQIFYEKMKADYYRYLTEFAQGSARDGNLFAMTSNI